MGKVAAPLGLAAMGTLLTAGLAAPLMGAVGLGAGAAGAAGAGAAGAAGAGAAGATGAAAGLTGAVVPTAAAGAAGGTAATAIPGTVAGLTTTVPTIATGGGIGQTIGGVATSAMKGLMPTTLKGALQAGQTALTVGSTGVGLAKALSPVKKPNVPAPPNLSQNLAPPGLFGRGLGSFGGNYFGGGVGASAPASAGSKTLLGA